VSSAGHVRTCSDLFGLVRTCSVFFGLVRTRSDLFGLVRNSLFGVARNSSAMLWQALIFERIVILHVYVMAYVCIMLCVSALPVVWLVVL
jgi:hypothetical protein